MKKFISVTGSLLGCLQRVSMVFQGRFKGASRKFCEVSRVFQESFKEEGCIKGVLSGVQGYLKNVQREFQ